MQIIQDEIQAFSDVINLHSSIPIDNSATVVIDTLNNWLLENTSLIDIFNSNIIWKLFAKFRTKSNQRSIPYYTENL